MCISALAYTSAELPSASEGQGTFIIYERKATHVKHIKTILFSLVCCRVVYSYELIPYLMDFMILGRLGKLSTYSYLRPWPKKLTVPSLLKCKTIHRGNKKK